MTKLKIHRRVFNCKETQSTIISDCETAIGEAISSIKHHRAQLEEYVRDHPEFLCSMLPTQVNKGPTVVKLMAKTSGEANVGPMAAVAGILADLAVAAMVSKGAHVAVIENGGEVSAVSDIPIDVALVAGDKPLSRQIGFRLEKFPIGIATSSGVFSHAFSFGNAEATTIFAENAGLADAAATAVCNLVRGNDYHSAIQSGIAKAMSIRGVEGVFILYRNIVGKAGQVPKILKLKNQ